MIKKFLRFLNHAPFSHLPRGNSEAKIPPKKAVLNRPSLRAEAQPERGNPLGKEWIATRLAALAMTVEPTSLYFERSNIRRFSVTFCCILTGLTGTAAYAMDGGQPASPADPLAQVSVAVQAHHPSPDGKMRVSECTGVRIADDLILTAAHCLDAVDDPARIAVFAYQGSQAVPPYAPVTAMARHPRHRRGWVLTPGGIESRQQDMAADMALLRIGGPLTTRTATLTGQSAASAVMGAGTEGASNQSGRLQRSALSGITFTRSAPRLAFGSLQDAQICRGDSGGPIGEGTHVWGISGAIIRGQNGCSSRVVIVPVDPASAAFQEMMRGVGK
jgi:hypothetical protein